MSSLLSNCSRRLCHLNDFVTKIWKLGRTSSLSPAIIRISTRRMASNGKIIGFAGVTNGGKTTTCRWIKQSLEQQGIPVTHLTMDHYYWDEDHTNHVLLPEFDYKYANWDDVCAVDWEKLRNDIDQWKQSTVENGKPHKPVLLVEGIMIYNHRELLPFFDKKYFFTLSKEECWKRRKERNYEPPEPEGYFDKIAWPYYLKLREQLSAQDDIVYLDGSRDQGEIFDQVKAEMEKLLNDS